MADIHDRRGDATRAVAPSGFTALPTGTLVDRYVITEVLAAGGFGITYVAEHTGLGRIVALKEHFPRQFAFRDGTNLSVRPTDPATFDWTRDRFLNEGRALTRCQHPGVVEVYDVFEANGTAYMALKFEDGRSLGNWLKALGRKPTQAELDSILAPLLDALAYVHSQDMLHRDIAPDNIMIRTNGQPCLIDFGAARQAMAQRSQVMSAIVKGGFSPPEQYTTTGKSQGPWSDVYALAATLYAALTGSAPIESTQRTVGDEMLPTSQAVGAAAINYRQGFLAAIDHGLTLSLRARPQSVVEWKTALFSTSAPALHHASASQAATQAIEPPIPPPRSASLMTAPQAKAERTGFGKKLVAAILGAVLLGGVSWNAVPRQTVAASAEQARVAAETARTNAERSKAAEAAKARVSVPQPISPFLGVTGLADATDKALQKAALWGDLKRDHPDWYKANVEYLSALYSQSNDEAMILTQLVGSVIKLRRLHAGFALTAPLSGLQDVADTMITALKSLQSHSIEACYGYVSQGEAHPTVLELLKSPVHAKLVHAQLQAVFSAIREGRATPKVYGAAKQSDFDILVGELETRGWTQADMRLFSDPAALKQAQPEKVCKMVREWLEGHLAIKDQDVQGRLLVDSLKPVISG